MKKTLAILLLLAGTASAQSFNYFPAVGGGSGGAGSPTSPGGTVTGANQYRKADGTFGGDDLVVDDGTGSLTLVNVSASGVVTGTSVYGTTLRASAGTTASPSLSFSGSPASGFYRPGNNQINLTLNGKDAMRYAQGSIGLMTSGTVPSATLHIGTVCPSGPCSGSGYFAGSLVVNGGNAGISTSIPGLEVSGTSFIGSCYANMPTLRAGTLCYGSSFRTLYISDGAASWNRLPSGTTIVSASGTM